MKNTKNKLETSKEAKAMGLRRISREDRPIAVRHLGKQIEKQKISINIDKDIIIHFKKASGGKGYQTLINNTLRDIIFSQSNSIADNLLNDERFIKDMKRKLEL